MKEKKKTNSRIVFYDTHISYEEFEEWKNDNILEAEMYEDDILSNEEYLEWYREYCTDANKINRDDFIDTSKALNDDEVIVAFVDLGFWNGRVNGFKVYGNNIGSIFSLVGCDDLTLYLENKNIKGELSHHDGTHYLTFRVVKNENVANRMCELSIQGKITREYVMRNSKSLVPYTHFYTKKKA